MKKVKDIDIIEVPVSGADIPTQFCVSERNERYYLAYETDVNKPYSVLFTDLTWIRKHFGVERLNENSLITSDSLNEGRRNEIANYELAIIANCPMWELGKIKNDGAPKINSKTGKPIEIYKLSEKGKIQFKNNIDKGLIVLCKYVG